MNLKMIVGFAAGIITSIAIMCVLGADSGSPTAKQTAVGPYAISSNVQTAWVVDTATGHLWAHSIGGGWTDEGIPQ